MNPCLEKPAKRAIHVALVLAMAFGSSSCFFFKKRKPSSGGGGATAGQYIGPKAGGPDEAKLEEIYGIATPHAPAPVRPDPDTVVRQILLQYRKPGSTVAREIGRVEKFRALLGGASEDFAVAPQETYDATSLLATIKVAEEVCEGLVAPSPDKHPGWASILPAAPSDKGANVRFLMQRFQGVPSAAVDDAEAARLTDILDASLKGGAVTNASYIPVCATLMIDAEALLL